jgi:small subunit ribosomal protein S2
MSEELKEVVSNEEEEVAADVMATVVHADNEPVVSVKRLLDAGCHFGHQTRRWNPAMKKFIYGSKNGIHILDLTKTVPAVQVAYNALKKIVADGGKVLFVGTKPVSKDIVKEEALRSGSFYVTNRWLGGTLTNFRTIQKRIKYLNSLETMEQDGSFDVLPKKEVAGLKKEKEKLLANLEGIKAMRRTPNAVVVVDPKFEHNAVKEAKKLNIPVFALLDTNADPADATYGIPSNDDAATSIQLIVGVLADAVVEAKGGQTMVGFNVTADEEVTMEAGLNSFDKAEELRLIKAKKIEDSKSAKKGKSSRKAPKKFASKAPKAAKPADEAAEAPVEEEPKAEEAVEVKAEKPAKAAKKPAAKKAAKAEEPKAE